MGPNGVHLAELMSPDDLVVDVSAKFFTEVLGSEGIFATYKLTNTLLEKVIRSKCLTKSRYLSQYSQGSIYAFSLDLIS